MPFVVLNKLLFKPNECSLTSSHTWDENVKFISCHHLWEWGSSLTVSLHINGLSEECHVLQEWQVTLRSNWKVRAWWRHTWLPGFSSLESQLQLSNIPLTKLNSCGQQLLKFPPIRGTDASCTARNSPLAIGSLTFGNPEYFLVSFMVQLTEDSGSSLAHSFPGMTRVFTSNKMLAKDGF